MIKYFIKLCFVVPLTKLAHTIYLLGSRIHKPTTSDYKSVQHFESYVVWLLNTSLRTLRYNSENSVPVTWTVCGV